jgi:hypothetical protein
LPITICANKGKEAKKGKAPDGGFARGGL